MHLNPYISFTGNCEEAFEFYKAALGGELLIRRFAGSPMESQVPPEAKNKIMHCSLVSNDVAFMGSDTFAEWQRQPGENITLSLATDTIAEADAVFAKLSAGGTVTMPMADQFWGSKFGMFKDKFGINWMVSCSLS